MAGVFKGDINSAHVYRCLCRKYRWRYKKVSRCVIAVKSIFKELTSYIHPKVSKDHFRAQTCRSRCDPLDQCVFYDIYSCFVASTLIVSIEGYDFSTNFTAVAATINNIGPGSFPCRSCAELWIF